MIHVYDMVFDFNRTLKINKPENPFLKYDLAWKLFRSTKEIFLYKEYFDTTIRSTKTGNRTENRTPDQPEIFMDELVCQYKFACIGIFSIGPTMFKRQPIAPRTTTTTTGSFISFFYTLNLNYSILEINFWCLKYIFIYSRQGQFMTY